jgi:hypothetical protein
VSGRSDKASHTAALPPYNVAIDGNVCGLGRVRHREFAMGCGEMSEVEFTSFLQTIFDRLAENAIDDSIHQFCMDWRHMGEMLAAGRKVYGALKNLCVRNKTNAGIAARQCDLRAHPEGVIMEMPGVGGCLGSIGSFLWIFPAAQLHVCECGRHRACPASAGVRRQRRLRRGGGGADRFMVVGRPRPAPCLRMRGRREKMGAEP